MNVQGHNPSHSPSTPRQANTSLSLITAQCVRSCGYRYIASGLSYCHQCYYILDPRFRPQYEWISSHHLVCGESFRHIICSRCNVPMMLTRPMHNCNECIHKYLEYLLECDTRGVDSSALPDPVVIYVNGSRYY